MPDEITVAIRVVTPTDKITLERSAATEPPVYTGESVEPVNTGGMAAHAGRLLGELADEVLGHYGFTDAFGQYVEIANILSGHDTGRQGGHVNAVRELAATAARATAQLEDTRDRLAWASNPDNWVVEDGTPSLRHQPGRAFMTTGSPALFGGEAAELRTFHLAPDVAARHMREEPK